MNTTQNEVDTTQLEIRRLLPAQVSEMSRRQIIGDTVLGVFYKGDLIGVVFNENEVQELISHG